MKEFLARLIMHEKLSQQEAKEALLHIGSVRLTPTILQRF